MIGDWGGGEAYALHNSMAYFQREYIRYILTRGQQGVKPAFCSIHFPHGGWSIMRSAYEEKPYENARHLTLHTGQGAHGRRDIDAITVYAYGRELLVDPGIRSYEAADLERYPSVAYDGIDYVVGSHSNYPGLVHRRMVLFVKPEYWIVLDEVTGQGEGGHIYDQNWHLAVDAGIIDDPVTKAVRTGYATGANLLIVPTDAAGIESRPTEFYVATKRMASVSQGEALAKGWRYRKSGPAPQSFAVVLYPYPGLDAPSVSVAPFAVVDANPHEVTALALKVRDVTDCAFVSRTGPRKMVAPSAKLTVEAEVAVVRTRGDHIESVRGDSQQINPRPPKSTP